MGLISDNVSDLFGVFFLFIHLVQRFLYDIIAISYPPCSKLVLYLEDSLMNKWVNLLMIRLKMLMDGTVL